MSFEDEDKDKAKYTLLTNIQFVQRDNLRMGCHALLIVEDDNQNFMSSGYQLRGFGTEAAWSVFNMWLDKDIHFPFELKPHESKVAMMMKEDGLEPIFTGNTLTLKDGTSFFLQSDNSKRPIDIFVRTGDICNVWEVLYRKTAEYWHAPYMPRLTYGPPSMTERRY